MECIKECYTLWAMNHIRNPHSIEAALALIQSCLHNGEWEDAEHYARHAMFVINDMTDNLIPTAQHPLFLAEGSFWLAQAIMSLARSGGIPPEGKQKAGEEATEFARQALEIHTRLRGSESIEAAGAMLVLAEVLDYFNNEDNDEILRLFQRSIVVSRRVEGSSSINVAAGENRLAETYAGRAMRARAVNDLDRCLANLELALPHFREAARIFRINNNIVRADVILRNIGKVEEDIRQIGITRATAATATATRG